MRTALLILALLAAPAFAGQTVWKWVDDKGVTHYSDQPVPGAQRVEISGGSRAHSTLPATRSVAPQVTAQPSNPYRNFEVWKPAAQETIVNSGGVVEVALRFEPEMQSGHSLYLYLDGRLVQDFPPNARVHTLRDVPRGSHNLAAVIQDNRGERVAESRPVEFFVRQESVAQPPVGPALRPPPKPRGQEAGNKLRTSQPSYATLNGAHPSINPQTNKPVRP